MSDTEAWFNRGRAGPYASAEEAAENFALDLARMKDHCERFSGHTQRGFVRLGQWTLDDAHIAKNEAGWWVTMVTHTIQVQRA